MMLPDAMLAPDSVALIRSEQRAAEEIRQLTPAVLDLLIRQKWLQVMQPEYCGGPGWSLSRVVQLFEALAWADANVGWCVNLGAGANMFAGYLPRAAAAAIFKDPKTWCAGSGAVSGVARPVAGGYRISGHWKYASGSAHATHFTANCYLGTADATSAKENFLSFLFPAAAVRRQDSWKVTGLTATSSNDFEVKDIFVPKQHTFSLLRPSPFADEPLFRFPFEVLAVVNMACMPVGIALHFLALFLEMAAAKKPMHAENRLLKDVPALRRIVAARRRRLLDDRETMYRLLEDSWQPYVAGGAATDSLLGDLATAARRAAFSARKLVQDLFPYCGMSILYTDAPINKVWRDMMTASQHYLLSPLYEP